MDQLFFCGDTDRNKNAVLFLTLTVAPSRLAKPGEPPTRAA